MTESLYERYKEALRTGHVALLRGALEEAARAYAIAAELAPSRPLPHVSLGAVLMRLGRLEEALDEYAEAVWRGPRDEGALLGQAEALMTAARTAEAAEILDRVADVQQQSGRLPEAVDTLSRAIALEETPERSQLHATLLDEVRHVSGDAGDEAAERIVARSQRRREVTAPAPEDLVDTPAGPAEEIEGVEEPVPAEAAVEPAQETDPAQEALLEEAATGPETTLGPELELEPGPGAEPDAPIAAEAPSGRGRRVETERQPTGDELLAAAEAADLSGDSGALRSLLVWTARAYAREGRFEAALDAAHRMLQRYPGDVDAHLVLVELYAARDWDALAIEKLTLMDRLAWLGNDAGARERIGVVANRTFPGDPRLEALAG